MSDEPTTPAPPAAEGARSEPPEAVISAQGALRLLLALLALWTFFSGLTLTFFQDAAAATIGGGLGGSEGGAAQRLLGVHLLVLGPFYGMLAWEPQRFRVLLWVPYVAQGGVVLATLYDIAAGNRDFRDGSLPLIVAAFFFVMLLYVTFAGRRPEVEPSKGEEPPLTLATIDEPPAPTESAEPEAGPDG